MRKVTEADTISSVACSSNYTPERRLVSAILQRAIYDLFCLERYELRSLYIWFQDSDINTFLSYRYITRMLDLDPDVLMKKLIEEVYLWRQTGRNTEFLDSIRERWEESGYIPTGTMMAGFSRKRS